MLVGPIGAQLCFSTDTVATKFCGTSLSRAESQGSILTRVDRRIIGLFRRIGIQSVTSPCGRLGCRITYTLKKPL